MFPHRPSQVVRISLILLAVSSCAVAPPPLEDFVGTWSAEFSRYPLPQIVYGTVHFDSVTTSSRGPEHLVGSFQLDSAKVGVQRNLVVALLGYPSDCIEVPGSVMAYPDSSGVLEIDFTPAMDDCG